MKWHLRFLELAALVASWSKDPSTKTGAAIISPTRHVLAVGFNGFPQSMPDMDAWYQDRAEKYSRIVHCEMNALIHANQQVNGATLYTYPFLSCDRCVVHMLQAGIKTFVAPKPSEEALTRWADAFERTRRYIKECGGVAMELDF